MKKKKNCILKMTLVTILLQHTGKLYYTGDDPDINPFAPVP